MDGASADVSGGRIMLVERDGSNDIVSFRKRYKRTSAALLELELECFEQAKCDREEMMIMWTASVECCWHGNWSTRVANHALDLDY